MKKEENMKITTSIRGRLIDSVIRNFVPAVMYTSCKDFKHELQTELDSHFGFVTNVLNPEQKNGVFSGKITFLDEIKIARCIDFTILNKGTLNGTNGTYIGLNAGYNITTGKNNTCIGYNAGSELTDECNIIIIGDNIPNAAKGQKDVMYIGENLLIGKQVFGESNTLYEKIKIKL